MVIWHKYHDWIDLHHDILWTLLNPNYATISFPFYVDSLNMVNATGQCQMSPENHIKDGTIGIDQGTIGIDWGTNGIDW